MKRLICLPLICFSVAGISSAADSQLLGLMMPDAKVLAGASITQILTSPLGQFLMAKSPLNDPNAQQLLQATGFDPARDITQVVAASAGTPGQQSGLAAIRGTFDVARIVEFAKSSGATVDQSLGVPSIISPDGKGMVAFLDSATVLAGDPASVAAAIPRKSSASTLDPALVAKANSLSGSQDVWVVSTVSIPATQSAPNGIDLSALQSIQQSSAGVKLGTNVVISAEAVSDTPQHANSLADLLRLGVSFASMNQSNPQIAQLANLLKSLTISTSGTSLQVSLAIPEDLIEQLAPANKRPVRRAALAPLK